MITLGNSSSSHGEVKSVRIRTNYGRDIDNFIKATHPDYARGWLKKYREANWHNIIRGLDKIILAKRYGIPTFYGILSAKIIRADGDIIDYGLISARAVTTTGAGFVVDAFQNLVELENMKYHGIGTGTNAEDAGNSALQTELTTQYNPDNTRATGSTTEGASGNIYKTVGTNTVDASVAITEHGIFSQAATGGGVLFDRSVFSVINLVSTDQLQTTYEWTMNTGG